MKSKVDVDTIRFFVFNEIFHLFTLGGNARLLSIEADYIKLIGELSLIKVLEGRVVYE